MFQRLTPTFARKARVNLSLSNHSPVRPRTPVWIRIRAVSIETNEYAKFSSFLFFFRNFSFQAKKSSRIEDRAIPAAHLSV